MDGFENRLNTYNVGIEDGYSVKEFVEACRQVVVADRTEVFVQLCRIGM